MSVMTSAFVDAAQLMAQVQGVPQHRFVVVEHPIASADQAGLMERAEMAVEAAVKLWLAPRGATTAVRRTRGPDR